MAVMSLQMIKDMSERAVGLELKREREYEEMHPTRSRRNIDLRAARAVWWSRTPLRQEHHIRIF